MPWIMAFDYCLGLGNATRRVAFLLKDVYINVFYNYCYFYGRGVRGGLRPPCRYREMRTVVFYSLEVFLKKYRRD